MLAGIESRIIKSTLFGTGNNSCLKSELMKINTLRSPCFSLFRYSLSVDYVGLSVDTLFRILISNPPTIVFDLS